MKYGVCQNKQCLFPKPCQNLNASHKDYVELLRKLRQIPGVKKVFVRSGIRFDYLLADHDDTFLRELCQYHVSGQLRVAPEHISDNVLKYMGKPSNQVYETFIKKYEKIRTVWVETICSTVSDVITSGFYFKRCSRTGRIHP